MSKIHVIALGATVLLSSAGCEAPTDRVDESVQTNDSREIAGTSESALIASADYDYSLDVLRGNYISQSMAFTSATNPRTTRDNKQSAVTVTWRTQADDVTTRRPFDMFGAGTVTTVGFPSYTTTTTFKFNPRAIARGTYYIYLTYVTNGEDRFTYIYRATAS